LPQGEKMFPAGAYSYRIQAIILWHLICRGSFNMKQQSLIYHPLLVPVNIRNVREEVEMRSGCMGELAVHSPTRFSVGSQVLLSLYMAESTPSLYCRVIWLFGSEGRYLMGLTFDGEDEAYKMRMVEQLCHIHAYQHVVAKQEGRLLSDEDAAREWIDRYSKDFPEVASVHLH
jgi:hypothetical protein